MSSEKTFFLEIVSPEGKVFGEDVEFCVLPGYDGQFGVLPNHAQLVSMLIPGEIKIEKNNKVSYYAVSGGFMEVSSNKVTVAADTCEAPESINKEEALVEKKAAEAEIAKLKDNVKELPFALNRLKIAETRLAVAAKAGTAEKK
jgi:F-type H+-transporting ATPase subunit epsilon